MAYLSKQTQRLDQSQGYSMELDAGVYQSSTCFIRLKVFMKSGSTYEHLQVNLTNEWIKIEVRRAVQWRKGELVKQCASHWEISNLPESPEMVSSGVLVYFPILHLGPWSRALHPWLGPPSTPTRQLKLSHRTEGRMQNLCREGSWCACCRKKGRCCVRRPAAATVTQSGHARGGAECIIHGRRTPHRGVQ